MADVYDGPIIDAHHHLWDLARGHYPWLTGAAAIGPLGDIGYMRHDYLIADYLADRGRSPLEETAWLETLPRPPGIAARYVVAAPLDTPDADALLDAQAACPRVAGVRETIRWHPDPAKAWTRRGIVAEAGWRRGLARLAPHGLLLELLMNPHQAAEVAALADDFPSQLILVNHCGTPNDRDPAGLARWREGLAAMGARDNIAIKLSNFSAYGADASLAAHRDTLLTCIDAFGPGRCLFGSDYPVARRTMAYAALRARFGEVVAAFSPGEQRAMFHDNAARLYRLDVGARGKP
jgi:predicted TIM-barrel fold metal-dependent hydrolase